jgi:hypothetical protein
MSKLFILCLLISGSVFAQNYTVGCYGETGMRAIQGTFIDYEGAEFNLDHIEKSEPDMDCDIQEEEIEEPEDDN